MIKNNDELDARIEAADAAANATQCGIRDCDGTFHDVAENQGDWHHRFLEHIDDTIDFEGIIDANGHAYAYVTSPPSLTEGRELTSGEVRALADKFESVPAKLRSLADQIDRHSAPEQRVEAIATNVRGALARKSMGRGARPLVEFLEVSPRRAVELYNGRRPFSLDQLELLSAYFGCATADWMSVNGPRTPYPFDQGEAMDRLVTAREERR